MDSLFVRDRLLQLTMCIVYDVLKALKELQSFTLACPGSD